MKNREQLIDDMNSIQNQDKHLRDIGEEDVEMFFCVSVPEGFFEYISQSVLPISGYTPEEFHASPQLLENIIHQDSRESFDNHWQRLLDGKADPSFKYRILHKSGDTRWVNQKNSIVHNEDGNPVAVECMITDITDRKQADEALRNSEERFKSLFNSMIEGACLHEIVYDDSGRAIDYKIIDVNPSYVALLDLKRETVVNRLASEIYGSTEPPYLAVYADVARTGDPYSFETYFPPMDKHFSISVFSPGIGTFATVFEDITERKRADQALHESEEKFRLLAENSIDCIWTMDKRLRFTYLSPSLETILGFKPDEWIGTPLYKHFRKKEFVRVGALAAMALKNYKTFNNVTFQTKMPNKYDEDIDIEITGKVLLDSKGNLIGLQGTSSDITGRISAEAALRESEETYRLLFENMAQGAFYQSSDGVIIDCNPAALEMFGLTRDQFLGTSSLDSGWKVIREDGLEIPGDEHPSMMALKTGKPVRNVIAGVYNQHKQDYVWLTINAIPQYRNKEKRPYQVFVTLHDITDRKKAEEALLESVAKMGSIFRASPIGIGIVANRVIREVNERFCDIVGYTRDELIGHTSSKVYPSKEEFERVGREKNKMIQEHGIGTIETRLKHKDGHEINVLVSSTPLDQSDFSAGVTFTVLDITDLKKAEEDRVSLEQQYRQAQKMESVGRLAGGVAHDFNNMLSVILGNTELAMGKVQPSESLHEDLQEILKAANRSAALTRQLLAFARKQTISPRVIDLNDTIAGVLKMLWRLIGEDIDLSWIPGKDLWSVKMDPSQIDQLLANLCVNARDAIDGVGRITIETANSTFDEEYCADHAGFIPGEYIQLIVSDDGCGMDESTLAKVFEPFYTTKAKGEGTGLGLSTVYGIVKQNNGFINVYSEYGHGSTFKIYIPRHPDESEAVKGRRASVEKKTGDETILLVEDEKAILMLCIKMLGELGYRVLAAGTPDKAIELAKGFPGKIHLLITDVVMPKMNGRELAGLLMEEYPDIRLLFMSGYTANVIAHHGVLDEGVHFIQKPFSIHDLAVQVRKSLEDDE